MGKGVWVEGFLNNLGSYGGDVFIVSKLQGVKEFFLMQILFFRFPVSKAKCRNISFVGVII